MFRIIGARYDSMLPTVILTNLYPDKVKQHVGDALADRMRQAYSTVSMAVESKRIRGQG